MPDWNSKQYLKFADERTQPSVDLLNRVIMDHPRKIIDIGCGPGNSTDVLARRFPQAYILGIDSSPNMIGKAKNDYPGLDFELLDAGKDLHTLDRDFDIVFSNACIQWIPDHNRLLPNMIGLLKKGGILAVQLPYNFNGPMHQSILDISGSQKWVSKFDFPRAFYPLEQDDYYDILAAISSGFSMWQTTYFHAMKSHGDIIEWYRGTGLRPYLGVLSEEDKTAFEQDVYTEIVKAFPIQKNGDIIFRFPRLFFVAIR